MGPVWLATAATRACAFHSFSSLPFMMNLPSARGGHLLTLDTSPCQANFSAQGLTE
jgi:hypothetical protein